MRSLPLRHFRECRYSHHFFKRPSAGSRRHSPRIGGDLRHRPWRNLIPRIGAVITGGVVGFATLWTPPLHEVQTVGAIPITTVAIDSWTAPGYSARTRPTTSLTEMRCQAWLLRNPSCPDPATLAKDLWPDVTQSPATLYLGLPQSCSRQYGRGFGVEYFGSSRTLIAHCYYPAPWLRLPDLSGSGSQELPRTVLVAVQTETIGPGILVVVRDDRVEHFFSDQSDQYRLGAVNI